MYGTATSTEWGQGVGQMATAQDYWDRRHVYYPSYYAVTVTTLQVGTNHPLSGRRREWKLAECSSPAPVPVELASLPPVVLPPPQARCRPARLVQLHGGTRERRALRRSIERKDARF